jgi:hypothetical protein
MVVILGGFWAATRLQGCLEYGWKSKEGRVLAFEVFEEVCGDVEREQ